MTVGCGSWREADFVTEGKRNSERVYLGKFVCQALTFLWP